MALARLSLLPIRPQIIDRDADAAPRRAIRDQPAVAPVALHTLRDSDTKVIDGMLNAYNRKAEHIRHRKKGGGILRN